MKTALLLALLSPAAFAAAPAAPAVDAKEALARLKAGSERFAAGKSTAQPYKKQIAATAHSQKPFAAVLGCMDSRVGPEIVFDQGIGDLFSVRVAGNVADEDGLGSLEYAAKAVGVRLIVVLGHTRCGAVKGACDGVELGNLTGLLAKIKPAVAAVPNDASAAPLGKKTEAYVDSVARENVRLTIKTIREKSPVLAALEKEGSLAIAGALYDVGTGKTEWLE